MKKKNNKYGQGISSPMAIFVSEINYVNPIFFLDLL